MNMASARGSMFKPLMSSLLDRPLRGHLLVAGVALGLSLLLGHLAPQVFRSIDERSAGVVWRASDSSQLERRFVLVDIDEKSLKEIGPWPWPRERMAELVSALDRERVGLKLFDVVFPESKDGDALLAGALTKSSGPAVVAQVFSLDASNTTTAGQLAGALPLSVCPPASAKAHGYLANGAAMGGAGHITPRLDPDGSVRQVPALICFAGKAYPALVLAGLSGMAGDGGRVNLQPAESMLAPAWTLSFPGLPGVRVPLDETGDMRVSYGLPRDAFVSVSAADVIKGRLPQAMLNQSWALVGATAFGLADTVPTPLGGAVSGLEVHAQLLSAILDDRLPYTPRLAEILPWVLAAIFALLLLLTARHSPGRFSRGRAVALPVLGVVLALAAFGVHALLLAQFHWFMDWSQIGFFVIASSLGFAMINHARSKFETARVFDQFSSHMPSGVAQALALSEATDDIQSQRKQLTVLFADIRNFSAFCEKQPLSAAQALHNFFLTATGLIEAHGGVVEHLVGDSIMAVWNGSVGCDDHAQRAVQAAQAIWRECSGQLPDVSGFDLEPLDIGIGLESGPATIGLFGPRNRRTHTLLGETVTVAVQLQALTGDLASPVLVGEQVASAAPGDYKPMGFFLLPGLTRSRRVFSLAVLTPAQQQERLKSLDVDRSNAA